MNRNHEFVAVINKKGARIKKSKAFPFKKVEMGSIIRAERNILRRLFG